MNLLMLALLKKSIDDRNAAAARARNRKKRTEKGGKGKIREVLTIRINIQKNNIFIRLFQMIHY